MFFCHYILICCPRKVSIPGQFILIKEELYHCIIGSKATTMSSGELQISLFFVVVEFHPCGYATNGAQYLPVYCLFGFQLHH